MFNCEWKEINPTLNWWGLYNITTKKCIIETTRIGMEAYKKLGIGV